jgi:hypothetical protein
MKSSPKKTKGRKVTPVTPTFSWLNPKCEVRETGKYGKGLFATAPIRKGEIVCIGGGYILTTEDEKWFAGEMADKPIEIEDDFYIGPRTDADIPLTQQVLINHSCDPNTGIKGQILYVAMRSIRPDREITYDYAMICSANPKSKLVFEFPCHCGAKNCRGKLTEEDWKQPKLQRRYKGYFSWYIQEKIDKFNRAKQRKRK